MIVTLKKSVSLCTVILLAASCIACGGENGTLDGKNNEKKNTNKAIEVADFIKTAIEESRSLSTGGYSLGEDGSVYVGGYGGKHEPFAKTYAALDVDMIACNGPETEAFALKDGSVYYNDLKVLDGVTHMAYTTTNSSPSLRAIAGETVYLLSVNDAAMVSDYLREQNPEHYTDIGNNDILYCGPAYYQNQIKQLNEAQETMTGTIAWVGVEKADFLYVTTDGRVFVDNNYGSSVEYEGLEIYDWENVAMIDAAKVMLSPFGSAEREVMLTVAAIQGDGTVLACGEYAEEIESWGKLAYISMNEKLIAGLTPDGKVKLAGEDAAPALQEKVAAWPEMAAISVANSGNRIMAKDKEGNFYSMYYGNNSDFEFPVLHYVVLSPQDGIIEQSDDGGWTKVTKDGSVMSSWDVGMGWELRDND